MQNTKDPSPLKLGASATTPSACDVDELEFLFSTLHTSTPRFPNNFSITSDLDSTLLDTSHASTLVEVINNNTNKTVDTTSSSMFQTAFDSTWLDRDEDRDADADVSEDDKDKGPGPKLLRKAKVSQGAPMTRKPRVRFVDVSTSPMTPRQVGPSLPLPRFKVKTSRIPVLLKRLQQQCPKNSLLTWPSISSFQQPSHTSTPMSQAGIGTSSNNQSKNHSDSKYQIVMMKPFLLKRKSEVRRGSVESHDGSCGCLKRRHRRIDTPAAGGMTLRSDKKKKLLLMSSIHEELMGSGVHCNITGPTSLTKIPLPDLLEAQEDEEEGEDN